MNTREEFLAEIEKTNELFNNSTKAEKRVMIAQDCIDRMQVQLIEPKCGSFIIVSGSEYIDKESVNNANCSVCAKGGLFASYIGRVNNFYKHQHYTGNSSNDTAHKKLREIFTLKQLAIIEFAFEGCQYIHEVDINIKLSAKLIAFHKKFDKYMESDKCFIAICENIIKNKGTFKV